MVFPPSSVSMLPAHEASEATSNLLGQAYGFWELFLWWKKDKEYLSQNWEVLTS